LIHVLLGEELFHRSSSSVYSVVNVFLCSRCGVSMLQFSELMAQTPERPTNGSGHPSSLLYCPTCAREVNDPLTCGDCSAVICRQCGTPLEMPEDLGIG